MKNIFIKILFLCSLSLFFTSFNLCEVNTGTIESKLSKTTGQKRILLLKQLADSNNIQSPTKSYNFLKEALELLKQYPDKQLEWELLNDFSYLCNQLGKYAESTNSAKLSLELAKQFKTQEKIAKSELRLGEAFRYSNDYDKAIEAFKHSMRLYRDLDNIEGLASIYNSMGLTYWELGEYPKVLEYYIEALKFFEELKDKKKIGTVLQNIGRVYWHLNNFNLSLDYYYKAKKIFEEVNDIHGLGMIYNNIAAVNLSEQKYEQALINFKISLKFKQQSGRKPLIATTLNNIGSLYEQVGDFNQAQKYYSQSLSINQEINNQLGISLGLLNLGSLNRKTKQYDLALRQLNLGLSIAQNIKKVDFISFAYESLSETYADKKDFKKALEYHQKYKNYSDKIFNEQTSKKLADVQKNYQIETKEKEIILLKKDQEIQTLAFSRQQSIKNFLIIVSILILLLAFVIYTRYRLKVRVMQKLQQEMEERKKVEAELLESRKLESAAILAGGIAHDFNNLLSVILGSLTLAKEKICLPEAETQDLLNKAEKASLQAADLIKNFITFSTGGWLDQNKIFIPEFLEHVTIHSKEMKNIRLEIDSLHKKVKPINGDSQKLLQVFLNVLSNADDAAHLNITNKVKITAQDLPLDESNQWMLPPGDYVNISVKDSGKGIPPQIIEKVFDPYFSTKERGCQKGMGLGLSICHAIIKKHNGHISVTSDLDKGTIVDICLPAFTHSPSEN